MPTTTNPYIWRCAKCSYHFITVTMVEGVIRIEKKCPKCKAVNFLTLGDKEITTQCKLPEEYQGDFSNNY